LDILKQDTEQAKLWLQHQRLELVREGKLSGGFSFENDDSSSPLGRSSLGHSPPFYVALNLQLLPKFTEKDPDNFFNVI
jgi:hypothetical protein